MGIPGPAPKPADKRARTNAETFPTTDLERAPSVSAPKLPKPLRYLPETRAWYAVWCKSPQAAQFLATDWQRLHMTAKLVDHFYRTEEPMVAKQLLNEIRLNEQKLGGTPEDRLRLRWRMREADAADEAQERRAQRPTSRARKDPRLKLVGGGEK